MAENSQPPATTARMTPEPAAEIISVSSMQDWNTGRYEQVAEIGVGAYGVVYKAKDTLSNEGYVSLQWFVNWLIYANYLLT